MHELFIQINYIIKYYLLLINIVSDLWRKEQLVVVLVQILNLTQVARSKATLICNQVRKSSNRICKN